MAEPLNDAEIDRVIQSGFPWNALGTRLKAIDDQFQAVTNEYASIYESIGRLGEEVGSIGKEVERIRDSQGDLTDRIRQVVREELPAMQDRWLIATGDSFLRWWGSLSPCPHLRLPRIC